ncbi:hypothetical protein GEMRC1_010166 [Eukaryota sp. GEM-RC1]
MPLKFYDESKVVNLPAKNLNLSKLETANKIFDELITDGFAFESPAQNPFSSPICLVSTIEICHTISPRSYRSHHASERKMGKSRKSPKTINLSCCYIFNPPIFRPLF